MRGCNGTGVVPDGCEAAMAPEWYLTDEAAMAPEWYLTDEAAVAPEWYLTDARLQWHRSGT